MLWPIRDQWGRRKVQHLQWYLSFDFKSRFHGQEFFRKRKNGSNLLSAFAPLGLSHRLSNHTFIICLWKFPQSTPAVFRLCCFDECSLLLLNTTHQMACATCGHYSLGTLKQTKDASWLKWKQWQVLSGNAVCTISTGVSPSWQQTNQPATCNMSGAEQPFDCWLWLDTSHRQHQKMPTQLSIHPSIYPSSPSFPSALFWIIIKAFSSPNWRHLTQSILD